MRIEQGDNCWNIYFTNSLGVQEMYAHPLEVQDCAVQQVWPGGIMRSISKELLESILVNDATAESLLNGQMSKMVTKKA